MSTLPDTGRKHSVLQFVGKNTGWNTVNRCSIILLSQSLVLSAAGHFLITRGITENTVLMPAISATDTEVQLVNQNDFKYHVTMSLVRKMVEKGLLTADEYAVIDTKMREKYRPKIGTLFIGKPLTNPP